MKTLLIRGAITAFVGLAVASMSAQTQTTGSGGTTYIETSKFIGKKVRSAQGEEIGTVKDIVLDRSTGCLAYTVVSTSGGGGTRATAGGKMVAVPWAVYSPGTDPNVFTVTVERDRIYNAPVFDYARVEEYSRPDYITNVYSYYGVSASGAVGAGVSTGTTTTGATTTAGAAAQAGATTSPGAATSPAAASGSPAEAASPGGRASATPHTTPAASPRPTRPGRAHATASPSSRGAQTASPPARAKGTPEQPRGRRGVTGSLPESQRSPSEAASPSERERTPAPQQRERKGKRETSSPSEEPQGQ
jgi:sporulation protein YlmC with PRC-barrel domain